MCTILNKQNVKPSLCKFNLLTSNWELSNFRGWNLKLESPQFHFHNVQYLIKFSLDLQRKRKVGSIVKKNKKQLIETKSKIVHVFPLAKPFFFFSPSCTLCTWKFPGQGSNLSCRCDLQQLQQCLNSLCYSVKSKTSKWLLGMSSHKGKIDF